MSTYLRNKSPWMQLLIFGCLTIGIMMVCFLVGMAIVANVNHMTVMQIAQLGPADYAKPEMAGIIKGLLIVQFFGIFFLPPLIFSYLADPHPLHFAGIRRPWKSSFILLALLTIIASYFTVELLGTMNEALVKLLPGSTQKWVANGEKDASGMLENVLSMKGPRDLMTVIFLVGILPAVGEELFFRGILQKLFIQISRSPWPGIIFTGFLFSAFHMQFAGLIPRMALGIILGALYWYSGSILISMLGHFVFNTINILLIYFKVADMDTKTSTNLGYSIIGVISLALVVFLLRYLRKQSSTSYEAEYPPVKEYSIFDEPDNPA